MTDKIEAAGQGTGKSPAKKYGTFFGVYLPSTLTILGVIMYLRMGWVVGQAGLAHTLLIITLASIITFITGLSISAIATNMRVKTGGAYYMVSRSFGVEAGAAVGLPLFLAQVVGIAFYLAGFSESIGRFFPGISLMQLAMTTLVIMVVLAYLSTTIVLKTQLLIFILILGSLGSLFLGTLKPMPFEPQPARVLATVGFWKVFAVFFPAVTGILSGLSMSGDLKNPARALPLGTLASVATGYVIYLAIAFFLNFIVPRQILQQDPMIIYRVALVRELILLGIWGATLSSALSSILAAPRTLQALAQDRVVPRVLGKSFGPSAEPRLAILLSFAIALAAIYFGDLNSIAPVLSMFFLAAYGALNLIAGVEGIMGNPSWRPSLKPPWWISILGAGLCLAAMLMINAGATMVAVIIVIGLYFWISRWQLGTGWADMRHGLLMTLARFSIYHLAKHRPNAKSWRPNLFVLSGAPSQRWHLIQLGNALTQGKGFFTVAAIVQKAEMAKDKIESMEDSIYAFLKDRKVQALVEVNFADQFMTGARELIKTYGMGPLAPNTFLFGEIQRTENLVPFAELIRQIHLARRNILIFHEGDESLPFSHEHKRIICWWRGQQHNAEFMLTLGHMLQNSREWANSELIIKTLVESEEALAPIQDYMDGYFKTSRIKATSEVIVDPIGQEHITSRIKNHSQEADLIFMGLRPPQAEEAVEDYADYYINFMSCIKDFPDTLIILGTEDIDFKDVLN